MKLVLLLLSGLKWGKLATTGGTMLLSLAVYATIWGWPYAAGFIALMFAHEMGHYVAARQCGLIVGAPAFYDGQRFSPLARIDKGNVKNLKLAYAVPLGGGSGNEFIHATPLAEDGFIYIT